MNAYCIALLIRTLKDCSNKKETYYKEKGKALYNLKKYREAIKCFDEALKINPHYITAKKYKESAEEKLKEEEKLKKIKELKEFAEDYKKQKDYKEAIKCYEEILELNPKDHNTWNSEGILHFKLEEYEEALNCFNEALKIKPDDETILKNKEVVEKKLNTPKQEKSTSRKISNIDESKFPYLKVLKERYENLEYINTGGCAEVWKAINKETNEVRALKVYKPDQRIENSFYNELDVWKNLHHENIVKIYGYHRRGYPFFIEMELCDMSLKEYVKEYKPNLKKIIYIMYKICEGLKYAHSKEIFNTDLKLENILMKNGEPKVTDWGAAPTNKGIGIILTPSYAAPEQLNRGRLDHRTDIWQIGVMLYYLTTGKYPFGTSKKDINKSITHDPIEPMKLNKNIPKKLNDIILKCLKNFCHNLKKI